MTLRSPDKVMDLARLGALFPYPLSFMRLLVRRFMSENWQIDCAAWNLDELGHGEVVYKITTPGGGIFHYLVFAKYLDSELRNDRVIAENWDMTAVLCTGELTDQRLVNLRHNVPLQERGRVDGECLVLTRANKSARNFDYVVGCLASGQQPDRGALVKVGYLYRTTAVYGSGKFGMADWEKLVLYYPDFASPFAAEMFSCFMIRHFSLAQVDHVAAHKGGAGAVGLDSQRQRYMGIGNATGLGMAPYLINHPFLIQNWIEVFEQALARVKRLAVMPQDYQAFVCLANKAKQHLSETETDNPQQRQRNQTVCDELDHSLSVMPALDVWGDLCIFCEANCQVETQELVASLLLEIFAAHIYDLVDRFHITESYRLDGAMRLSDIPDLIVRGYDWALKYDFSDQAESNLFWYRSENKMEPRIGRRDQEPGVDREMFMNVAQAVQLCYQAVQDDLRNQGDMSVAEFCFSYPHHRYILRRIQTMARTSYGEIHANFLATDVLPIDLLRCKLSFFGVGKFDPRSRLWVRNVMFQGAPLASDIGTPGMDSWCFATLSAV